MYTNVLPGIDFVSRRTHLQRFQSHPNGNIKYETTEYRIINTGIQYHKHRNIEL